MFADFALWCIYPLQNFKTDWAVLSIIDSSSQTVTDQTYTKLSRTKTIL